MRLFITCAIIAATSACLMGQALPEFFMFQLEATTKSRRVILDSRGATPIERAPDSGAVVSPDRRRAAFVDFTKEGDAFTSFICIAPIQSDGSLGEKRELPVSDESIIDLRWMPDGRRLVYVRGRSPQEIFMIDVDDPAAGPQRISEPGPRSFAPRIARDGRIAYLVERGRKGKGRLTDLIIFDGASRKAVLENTPIMEHAFSPDSKRIALSSYHELIILNLETGERMVRDFKTFHDRLNSFHASCLAWRPDGQALAAVLHFSGGVAFDPTQEPQPMFGDREVFILPLDNATGAAIVFTLEADVRSVQWIDGC